MQQYTCNSQVGRVHYYDVLRICIVAISANSQLYGGVHYWESVKRESIVEPSCFIDLLCVMRLEYSVTVSKIYRCVLR